MTDIPPPPGDAVKILPQSAIAPGSKATPTLDTLCAGPLKGNFASTCTCDKDDSLFDASWFAPGGKTVTPTVGAKAPVTLTIFSELLATHNKRLDDIKDVRNYIFKLIEGKIADDKFDDKGFCAAVNTLIRKMKEKEKSFNLKSNMTPSELLNLLKNSR
jgi:hypothetical protein